VDEGIAFVEGRNSYYSGRPRMKHEYPKYLRPICAFVALFVDGSSSATRVKLLNFLRGEIRIIQAVHE